VNFCLSHRFFDPCKIYVLVRDAYVWVYLNFSFSALFLKIYLCSVFENWKRSIEIKYTIFSVKNIRENAIWNSVYKGRKIIFNLSFYSHKKECWRTAAAIAWSNHFFSYRITHICMNTELYFILYTIHFNTFVNNISYFLIAFYSIFY